MDSLVQPGKRQVPFLMIGHERTRASKTLGCPFILIVGLLTTNLHALTITLDIPSSPQVVNKNAEVKLTVSDYGVATKVQIGSELARASQELELPRKPQASFSAGRVTGPGYFTVLVVTDVGQSSAVGLFIAPAASPGAFEAILVSLDVELVGGGDKLGPLLRMLVSQLSENKYIRLKNAMSIAWKPWSESNAAGLAGTKLVCTVTLLGGQWYICAAAVGGKAIDLAFATLDVAIDQLQTDKVFTADEAALLKKNLATAWTGLAIAWALLSPADGVTERVLSGALAAAGRVEIKDHTQGIAYSAAVDGAGTLLFLLGHKP